MDSTTEDKWYRKVKSLLYSEMMGKQYASKELSKMRQFAEDSNSEFYERALRDFNYINSYSHDLSTIKSIVSTPEMDSLARTILGFNNPYEQLSKQDIIKYFFNLPDNVAICEVVGQSMINVGIDEGDNLLYIKTNEIDNGDMVIAVVDGKKYVKRYRVVDDEHYLVSENDNYPNFRVGITDSVIIMGKVIQIIKSVNSVR